MVSKEMVDDTQAKKIATYTNALIQFGERNQMIVAVEELSECQKEICKILRGGEDFRHLAEEIADAQIMLEQLIMIFSLQDCVENYMEQKIQRLDERCRGMAYD